MTLLMGSVCLAQDISIYYKGNTAKVSGQVKDSVSVTVEGAHVSINSTYQTHQLTVRLAGKSDDGQLILKTAGKAKVKLDGVSLTCQEGAPLWLKNKKRVKLVAADGTKNALTIATCTDTTNHKAAAIWSKDKVKFSGTGTLDVLATGDGCKGIRTKDNITVEELTLNVATTGNNLGEDTTRMGGFGGPPPNFDPDHLPEEVKAHMEEMKKHFEERQKNGEHPMMGGHGGPMGGMPPGGGKHKYIKTAKGIKSLGCITVHSGTLTVTTASPGAEGIEGKEGVVLNGGDITVTAVDDAINANACIEFNGANVTARSTTNDAVDANLGGEGGMPPFGGGGFPMQEEHSAQSGEPAIIIRGGTVYAWSEIGAPEEGLDCDASPIEVSGGTVFSVGAGMGDMPSVPTQETAKQPTALLIGINIVKDEPIQLYDSQGKLLEAVTVPFSLQRSSSLISSEKMQVGATYTVKTLNCEKTFCQTENFTIVR